MATRIKYDDITIASIGAGQSAILNCLGLKMKTDITVENDDSGTVELLDPYDGHVKLSGAQVEDFEEETFKCQDKIATSNGLITPDAGYNALRQVSVNVPIPDDYVQVNGELEITGNGTFNVRDYESVIINVQGNSSVYNNTVEVY